MKRFFSMSLMLIVCHLPVSSLQTQDVGKLKGRVVDIAGMPIPKVQITIQSSTDSFKATSDEDGYFEVQVPVGSYEVSSEKLPGFAATKQTGVRVERSRPVEIKIVPAVSTEGVLCLLYVTGAPTQKQKKRKRHR